MKVAAKLPVTKHLFIKKKAIGQRDIKSGKSLIGKIMIPVNGNEYATATGIGM
jgi:hypothetical protein